MNRRMVVIKVLIVINAVFWLNPSCRLFRHEGIVLRFAVASDGHYGQEDIPYKKIYADLIEDLNEEEDSHGLDFVFLNGDHVQNSPQLLDEVKRYYDGLRFPYYAVLGNHERTTSQYWRQLWGYPANHDFEHRDYAFILLNTAHPDGKYRCADAAWLEERLDYYQDKTAVFLVMHISQKTWTKHGIDCPEVSHVISTHDNVGGVFYGHDHQEDSFKTEAGKHYFWDGRFGGGWGVDYLGYRIIEVFKSGKIITYQAVIREERIINRYEYRLKQQ